MPNWSKPAATSNASAGSRTTTRSNAIAAAAAMTDELYGLLIERGLAGRTEAARRRLADRLDARAGRRAFVPADRRFRPERSLASRRARRRGRSAAGELVTVDMGVRLDGYCSDCTRTFATGSESELDDLSRELYEVTLKANEAGLAAVRAGASGSGCRRGGPGVIRDAGYGENFGHGLGHGVGLEIHEAPRLGPSSEDELLAGEVVTVEPGIYIPGETGVRIEDLVVVGTDGIDRNLSTVTKELTLRLTLFSLP